MNNEIDELLTRGVENIIPKELAEKKLSSGEPMRIYFGIDPTGAKLHLGHSVPLRKLKAFSDLGHHVILVVGSFTAMIGDPSGRDILREPLTKEQVEKNFQTYKTQAEKILDLSKVEVRYNHEWLEPLTLPKLIELASSFTVQQMLQRDMFDKRLKEGKPIALHEFLYPLMVGYDSVVLDVDCELGGSDQEFNMLAGRHMQQAHGKRDKFVLTTHLIEGTDGRKMSKTYDNCVYLEDEPSNMYGKIMSIKDELVKTYFECATNVPMNEVEQILAGHPKEAKMRLAREIVALYHGEDSAQKAEGEFNIAFTDKGTPDDIETVSVERGAMLVDVLMEHKLVTSRSEFTRLLEQGAIKNIETGKKLDENHLTVENEMVLRIGKYRFLKITV
jgi:tyrosyl-tRNA synthetase